MVATIRHIVSPGLVSAKTHPLHPLLIYISNSRVGLRTPDCHRTPLHMAVTCSGRLFKLATNDPRLQIFSDLDLTTAIHYRDIHDKYRTQTDILDTFRVPVEQGQNDPMATDIYGHSALHLVTGSWDDFHYLMNQEYYYIDIILFRSKAIPWHSIMLDGFDLIVHRL